MTQCNLDEYEKLIRLKSEDPKRYKEFLEEIEDIATDLMGIVSRVSRKELRDAEERIKKKTKPIVRPITLG